MAVTGSAAVKADVDTSYSIYECFAVQYEAYMSMSIYEASYLISSP